MKARYLILFLLLALALSVRAEHTFAGSFVTPPGPIQDGSLLAGSILLTVDKGEASYTCTLFSYIPMTGLQAWLTVGHKKVPIDLGAGLQGTWPLQEFLWPVPGVFTPGGIDPGFGIPPTADGTRFTGSFSVFPDLEQAMLAKGARIWLQVHGAVAGLQDPLLWATLQDVTPVEFTANFSGRNEVPPNNSRYHGTGTFTLIGNYLTYGVAIDAGLAWTSAAVFGPASPRSNSRNLVAEMDTSPGVVSVPLSPRPSIATQVSYSGVLNLTDAQADQLKHGELYVNFFTARYPRGEIRGQILPVPPNTHRRKDVR
jgi:hypothetical protein